METEKIEKGKLYAFYIIFFAGFLPAMIILNSLDGMFDIPVWIVASPIFGGVIGCMVANLYITFLKEEDGQGNVILQHGEAQ